MSATTSRRGRRLTGLAGLLGTAVLLVVGRAATAPPPTGVGLGAPEPPPAPAPSGSPGSAPPAAASTGPATTSRPTAAGASGSFLGRPEFVDYGTVQVRVTLTGGRITDVQAVQMPSGGRSSEIADYAAPRLRSEVLAAQSAHIDTVSGASYDSEGYAKSVQSALDAAPR
jgi:uncharacterized protein with FMN-binding domain